MTLEAFVPPGPAGSEGWRAYGRELREEFQGAAPWPHLVLDELVRADFVAAAEQAELPYALALLPHRSHRQVKAESAVPGSQAAQILLDDLAHPDFVLFLEELTGIDDLQADPTHYWAGVHAFGRGAFQAVHHDFIRHPANGLFHRVNVLLYLNSDWEPSFEGDLELWSRDLKRCEKRIQPILGRIVIFGTEPTTYHGIPQPMGVPRGRLRLSLASNYYTAAAPPYSTRTPLLRRPRRPQDPWHVGIASPLDALTSVRALYRRDRKARALSPRDADEN